MEFFKKVIIIFSISLVSAFAFSKKPSLVLEEEFALLKNKNETCFKEIEKELANMLDIKKIKISRSTFIDNSYLYLSNQKNRPFEKTNKMQGYVDANLVFLLHAFNNSSYISLVDEKNKILKSKKIKNCETIKAVK